MKFHQNDRDALESDLKRWGYWHGRQIMAAVDGYYTPISLLARLIEEWQLSRSEPTSKILIVDMPKDVWLVHYEIFDLPYIYIQALTARYCLPARAADGRAYRKKEICQAVGCNSKAFDKRIVRAKRAILAARALVTLDMSPTGETIAQSSHS